MLSETKILFVACVISYSKLYQNEDGSYKRAGDIVKNEALAETLQRIAENGAQEFYNGEIAKNIVADLQAMGMFAF